MYFPKPNEIDFAWCLPSGPYVLLGAWFLLLARHHGPPLQKIFLFSSPQIPRGMSALVGSAHIIRAWAASIGELRSWPSCEEMTLA